MATQQEKYYEQLNRERAEAEHARERVADREAKEQKVKDAEDLKNWRDTERSFGHGE